MTNLRRDVDWDPKDEENNWRSLARAYQAQAVVSLSRNQFADAMEQYRQAEEIIARLAAADPDDLTCRSILLKIQRELGQRLHVPTGRHRGGPTDTFARPSRLAGHAWRRSPTTRLQE